MKAKRKQEHMHVQEKWQWIIMWIIRGLEWMERRREENGRGRRCWVYMEEAEEAESIPEREEPAERDCPEADPPDGVWVIKESSKLLQQGRHFPNRPAHFAATFLLTQ